MSEKRLNKTLFPGNAGACERRGAEERERAMSKRICQLERMIEDSTELLHLWKNEACAYRMLVERLIEGGYSVSKARKAISQGSTIGDVLKSAACGKLKL